MAHECPDCGYTCHCNGDIDDCCFNFEEDIVRCKHCPEEDEDGADSGDIEEEYD